VNKLGPPSCVFCGGVGGGGGFGGAGGVRGEGEKKKTTTKWGGGIEKKRGSWEMSSRSVRGNLACLVWFMEVVRGVEGGHGPQKQD